MPYKSPAKRLELQRKYRAKNRAHVNELGRNGYHRARHRRFEELMAWAMQALEDYQREKGECPDAD